MIRANVLFHRARAIFSLLALSAAMQLLGVGILHAQERGWGDTWTGVRSQREHEKEDRSAQVIREVQGKEYAKAEQHLGELIRESPEDVRVRLWSAAAHATMHRYDAALRDCADALELVKKQEPEAAGEIYRRRAEVYDFMGNAAACRADLEHAVHIDRTNVQFNNALAWFLATSPDAAVRDGGLTVRYAEAANKLSGSHDPEIIDTLAAAEAEAGDFDAAVQYEREALALAKGKKLRGGDKRLRLYENHQPFRMDEKHENSGSD